MQLGRKIADGRYRECREVLDTPELCAKINKPTLVKQYPFGLKIHFPMRLYTLLKFGIADFNRSEVSIVKKLPPELRQYAPERMELVSLHQSDTALLATRLYDFDGQPSTTLQNIGVMENEPFWREIDQIVEIMLDHRLHFFDIFHLGNNIIARREDSDVIRPVLIDFKRLGYRTYPFQLDLLTEKGREGKFLRRLQQFKERFQHGKPASNDHREAA